MPLHDVSQNDPEPFYPGYEFGYDQITADVNVTSTIEATPTTILTCASHIFDGQPVLVTFFTPYVVTPNVAGGTVQLGVSESGTQLGKFLYLQNTANVGFAGAIVGHYRFTPTAGSHTYAIYGFVSSTSGTPRVGAGAAGAGNPLPAFVRFTKI